MKLQWAEGGVWWISKVDEVRSPKGISLHRIVSAVSETFHFSSVPTGAPKDEEAFSFREGYFADHGEEIVIRIIELYTNGVHIVTPGGTDGSDKVLSRTIQLFSDLGMRFPESEPIHFHTSEIVVDMAKSLNEFISKFAPIQTLLTRNIPLAREIQSAALAFNSDPISLSPAIASVNPTIFRIERRAGETYGSNRYFSFANTTTSKHLAILEGLERLLGS
jgi:hypothetical protein